MRTFVTKTFITGFIGDVNRNRARNRMFYGFDYDNECDSGVLRVRCDEFCFTTENTEIEYYRS